MTPGTSPDPSLVGLFLAPLNRTGLSYVVTGGLAAVVYGHPRLTVDVDVVLRLAPSDATAFAGIWDAAEFYVPPAEAIAAESARETGGHVNVVHGGTGMRADIYFAGDDPLQAWALAHPAVRTIEGEQVPFAPVEYVIVYKLVFARDGGSDRHLHDVARILAVSGETLDRPVLEEWIERCGVTAEWRRVNR